MKKYEVRIKTGLGYAEYVSYAESDEEMLDRYKVGDWCDKGQIKNVESIYENLGINEFGVIDLRKVK